MKFRSLLLSALCALSVGAVFTSCSDDDDPIDDWRKDSVVELAQTRAFVLNEGQMSANNSNLIYFDWSTNTPNTTCIFTQQNGAQLGDTGNDIITFDGKMAVAVNGSNYVTLLNGAARELARVSFADGVDGNAVAVRNLVEKNGALYVTTYGGLVLKLHVSDNDLTFNNEYVSVGANLEGICEQGGKLYVIVAGSYPENDSRVAIIPLDNFSTEAVTFGDVMYNPDQILAVDGHILVQGYGAYYDYPFGEYNTTTGEFTQLGNATAWTAYDGKVFLANSVTDWNTYATTTTLAVYDVATGETKTDFFTNVPEGVTNAFVYSISANPYTGELYIGTSDYVNDGKLYRFTAAGTYAGQLSSCGLNPNKVVFLR